MQIIHANLAREIVFSEAETEFQNLVGVKIIKAAKDGMCSLTLEMPNVRYGLNLDVLLRSLGYEVTRNVMATYSTITISWQSTPMSAAAV